MTQKLFFSISLQQGFRFLHCNYEQFYIRMQTVNLENKISENEITSWKKIYFQN